MPTSEVEFNILLYWNLLSMYFAYPICLRWCIEIQNELKKKIIIMLSKLDKVKFLIQTGKFIVWLIQFQTMSKTMRPIWVWSNLRVFHCPLPPCTQVCTCTQSSHCLRASLKKKRKMEFLFKFFLVRQWYI